MLWIGTEQVIKIQSAITRDMWALYLCNDRFIEGSESPTFGKPQANKGFKQCLWAGRWAQTSPTCVFRGVQSPLGRYATTRGTSHLHPCPLFSFLRLFLLWTFLFRLSEY